MTALILENSETRTGCKLARISLSGRSGYDEKWLQELLFNNPELIPLDRISPGSGSFIPLAREFTLPREGGNAFLDVLGVTPLGRLVLVECKLWRNPQARREVVAQIMEYAALLRGWTYGDLTARFKTLTGSGEPNPLFDAARSVIPSVDETDFVEGVTASLARAEFQLIIAGDGIRSDLHAVASHLNAYGTSAARLSLLEVQLWSDGAERVIVVPTIQLRTEVIEQRVITAADGRPLEIHEQGVGEDIRTNEEGVPDPGRIEQRQRNRAFWQRFIDEVRFDNPDQQKPRHGGNNWVRFDMPAPATWITAYRYENKLGLTLLLKGDAGANLFESWSDQAEDLQKEAGLELRFKATPSEHGFSASIGTNVTIDGQYTEDDQLDWFKSAANRFVNLFRPRLSQWNSEEHSTVS